MTSRGHRAPKGRAAFAVLDAAIELAEVHIAKLEAIAERCEMLGHPGKAEFARSLADVTWGDLDRLHIRRHRLLDG